MSQQILIGFVDQLEINEPEDLHEKDERDLGKGERECTYMYVHDIHEFKNTSVVG